MKKITTLLLLAVTICALAQTSGMSFKKHGLGLSLGPVSGGFLTYRQMNDKWGFQVTAGGFYESSDDTRPSTGDYNAQSGSTNTNLFYQKWDEGTTTIMTGLTFYYPFYSSDNLRLYGLAGYNYNWMITAQKDGILSDIYVDSSTRTRTLKENSSTTKHSNDYIYGAGIGMEWNYSGNFTFALELPISVTTDNEVWFWVPQIGFFYYL